MRETIRRRLLKLNQDFYQRVAEPFDATRQQATPGLAAILPYFEESRKGLSVLDVGCGNGRFARLLDEAGIVCDYTGVDGSAELLALAAKAAGELSRVRCRFVQRELSDPGWTEGLGQERWERLLCTATLQHLPGYDLRLRLLQDFARLCNGTIALSFWQFLGSERFRARLIDWSAIGLDEREIESGDALLPWKQGVEAIRYVHQVDAAEAQQLAEDAGLTLLHTFRADGKEGDLNLYAILHAGAESRRRISTFENFPQFE